MPTTNGNTDLRNYVQDTWNYLALVDTGGNEVLRVDITNDGRVSFSSGSSNDPLRISMTVEGADTDVPLPVTFARSELYRGGSAPTPMSSEPYADANLQVEADTLDLDHEVSITS